MELHKRQITSCESYKIVFMFFLAEKYFLKKVVKRFLKNRMWSKRAQTLPQSEQPANPQNDWDQTFGKSKFPIEIISFLSWKVAGGLWTVMTAMKFRVRFRRNSVLFSFQNSLKSILTFWKFRFSKGLLELWGMPQ